jgi:hypothetical protein
LKPPRVSSAAREGDGGEILQIRPDDLHAGGQAVDMVRSGKMSPPPGRQSMPTISQFYGISIRMFYDDHEPPHIHARYNEFRARFDIETGAVDFRLCCRRMRCGS